MEVMRLNTVGLPAPLGPMRPTISSSVTAKSRSVTTCRPPKCLETPLSVRRGAPAGIALRYRSVADGSSALDQTGAAMEPQSMHANTRTHGPPHLIDRRLDAPLSCELRDRLAT